MARGPAPRGADDWGPPADAPGCPAWLDGEARAEWLRVAPALAAAGRLAAADRAALAAYCQAWAEFMLATNTLQTEGRYLRLPVQTAKGETIGERVTPHPALMSQRDAMQRLKAYLAEFGLSPLARARLGNGGAAGDGGADPLAALVARDD